MLTMVWQIKNRAKITSITGAFNKKANFPKGNVGNVSWGDWIGICIYSIAKVTLSTTQISYEPKQFWSTRPKSADFGARTPAAAVREPPKLLWLDKICLATIWLFECFYALMELHVPLGRFLNELGLKNLVEVASFLRLRRWEAVLQLCKTFSEFL